MDCGACHGQPGDTTHALCQQKRHAAHCAHAVGRLQRPIGYQPGDRAGTTIGLHDHPIQRSIADIVGIDCAIAAKRQTIKATFARDTPRSGQGIEHRVFGPDVQRTRARFPAQQARLTGVGDIDPAVGAERKIIAHRVVARHRQADFTGPGFQIERFDPVARIGAFDFGTRRRKAVGTRPQQAVARIDIDPEQRTAAVKTGRDKPFDATIAQADFQHPARHRPDIGHAIRRDRQAFGMKVIAGQHNRGDRLFGMGRKHSRDERNAKCTKCKWPAARKRAGENVCHGADPNSHWVIPGDDSTVFGNEQKKDGFAKRCLAAGAIPVKRIALTAAWAF